LGHCSENHRRVPQDAILRYVFSGRGVARGMTICPGNSHPAPAATRRNGIMNRDGIFMGRGAARGMENCSENGPVPQSAGLRLPASHAQAGGLRYIFIRRGAARGMAICSENHRRMPQDGILRYVFSGRGAARGMAICSENILHVLWPVS
jgi:hypothetical protein